MSKERTLDVETFRKTPFQRWLEWWRCGVLSIHSWWKDAIGRLRQHGWSETQAEVVWCIPVDCMAHTGGEGELPVGGWIVFFEYTVNGKKFEGIFNSRSEVEKADTFAIRYNPERPEENNTTESELGWFNGYVFGLYAVLLVLLIASLAIAGMMMRR